MTPQSRTPNERFKFAVVINQAALSREIYTRQNLYIQKTKPYAKSNDLWRWGTRFVC
jgi:hypothetical protein